MLEGLECFLSKAQTDKWNGRGRAESHCIVMVDRLQYSIVKLGFSVKMESSRHGSFLAARQAGGNGIGAK